MSDERLRLLSRSDSHQDRARVLVEAVRRGDLTQERLEWAASRAGRWRRGDVIRTLRRQSLTRFQTDGELYRVEALRGRGTISEQELDAAEGEEQRVTSAPEALAANVVRSVIEELDVERRSLRDPDDDRDPEDKEVGCGATDVADAAAAARVAADGLPAERAEFEWQRLRLADYALGRAPLEGIT